MVFLADVADGSIRIEDAILISLIIPEIFLCAILIMIILTIIILERSGMREQKVLKILRIFS